MKFKLLIAVFLLLPFAACSSDEKAAQPEQQAAVQQPAPAQQPPAQEAPQPESQTPPGYAQQPPPAAEYPAEPVVKAPARSTKRPVAKPRTQAPEPSYEPAPPADVADNRGGQDDQVVMPSPRRRIDDGSGVDASPAAPTAPVAPPPPPAPTTAVLEEGAVLDIRLLDDISTARNKQGDSFAAVLDRDLEVDGKLLAPKGAKVTGKLTEVVSSGKVQGLARLSMVLTSMTVDGERYSLETNPISAEAENTKARDAKTVGAGAGIGAVIGAIAGGKKGAAIGAAVGGGAGATGVLLTKGKEVEFLPEHKFSFRLEKDIEMKIQ